MKRIATIQDISCLGKCSLTVALPAISALGVECCVVPTAVLSTHTQFKDFTFRDLTEDLEPIKEHWEKEKFTFDAIYTGYLGSDKQIDIAKSYFKTFKSLKIVDPAMADNGKLYVGFTREFALNMATLCKEADIIVPNLTEAAFMLDEPYIGDKKYTEKDIKEILRKLCKLGAKTAILTGVSFEKDKIGVMALNTETGKFFKYFNSKVPASFHGTGDLFASVMTGAIARGVSLQKSLKLAADFTRDAIELTLKEIGENAYGVVFEELMPELTKKITKLCK